MPKASQKPEVGLKSDCSSTPMSFPRSLEQPKIYTSIMRLFEKHASKVLTKKKMNIVRTD
jgi:hypothetical protein